MQFSRLGVPFKARHILGAGQGEEVAHFRGVQKILRPHDALAPAIQVPHRDSFHPIPIHIGRGWLVSKQYRQPAAAHVRCQHTLQDGERNAGLMGQARHRPVPWIQVRLLPGCGGQGIVPPVILPDPIAVLPIGSRAAERFNPRMFVRRHALRRKLPSDPVGLFRENHARPVSTGGQSRRAAAHPAADHGHIELDLPGAAQRSRHAQRKSEESAPPHMKAF